MYIYINENSPRLKNFEPNDVFMEEVGFELTEFKSSWYLEYILPNFLVLAVEIDADGKQYETFVYDDMEPGFIDPALNYGDVTKERIDQVLRDISCDLGVEIRHVHY